MYVLHVSICFDQLAGLCQLGTYAYGLEHMDSCEYSMYVLVINLRVRDIGNLCTWVSTCFDSLVETLGHSLKFYVLVE